MVRIVIEWSKHFVNVADSFISNLALHIVKIVESEFMAELDDEAVETLTDFHWDVYQSLLFIAFLKYNLSLGQVNIEVVKAGAQPRNLIFKSVLFVVLFYQWVGLKLT